MILLKLHLRGQSRRRNSAALTTGSAKCKVIVELDGEKVEVEADVEIDLEDMAAEDLINEVVAARKSPSQIVDYNDAYLEKRYVFGKNLMPRIIAHTTSNLLELDSDVRLTHYRLQKLGENSLDLTSG